MRDNGFYPHTITVYNRYQRGGFMGGMPPLPGWDRTIIKNVEWKDKSQVNATNDGKSYIGKTITITIPQDESVVIGNKRYVHPKEYALLPNDTDNAWTLQENDVIVFGECEREITSLFTITRLMEEFRATTIRAVRDSSEQDILPCWKAECA